MLVDNFHGINLNECKAKAYNLLREDGFESLRTLPFLTNN